MHKASSLIVSAYIALVLFTQVPLVRTLVILDGEGQLFWNRLAIFMIFLVPTFFIISRSTSSPYSRKSASPVSLLAQSVALAGLVVAIFYHIIPLDPVYDLPSQLDRFFASDLAFTIWLILPVLALLI